MVISFINQKGGVGKSTLATNFACVSAAKKKKTILIDMDPQRSAMNFREIRPDDKPQFQAVSVLNPTIHKDIASFNFDVALIDSGGRDSKLFRSAMIASDLIVLPVLPGQFDIWSLEDTLGYLEEIREAAPDVKAGIVLNHVIEKTHISSDAKTPIEEFCKDHKIQLFKTVIHSRVAFGEASSRGLSVCEIAAEKFQKAATEIYCLFDEVTNAISD